MTGNVMTLTVIPWFVLQTTGSATRTGVAAFFNVLPIVVANLLGGALIDRLGFRTVSIVSDGASGVTLALIPLLHAAGQFDFWVLPGARVLRSAARRPGGDRSFRRPGDKQPLSPHAATGRRLWVCVPPAGHLLHLRRGDLWFRGDDRL